MRLIDGDALYDALADKLLWLMQYGDDTYLSVGNDIRKTIADQPTAYDVEKVVEQLEDLEVHFDNDYFSSNREAMVIKNDAIEIVKQVAAEYNNGWIPCEKEMPKEHDSIFARYKGTDKWNDSMFEKISDEVNVTIADKKGNTVVTHAHTADGKWSCDLLRVNKYYRFIAWQPMPTEYKQNGE